MGTGERADPVPRPQKPEALDGVGGEKEKGKK
jgi:hypothetical protein